MYFDVSVIFVIVLMTSNYMDSAPSGINYDSDYEWDDLFGHLSKEPVSVSRVTKPDKFFLGKHGQSKPSERPILTPTSPATPLVVDPNKPVIAPAPPAPPFVFDPNSKDKIPSIGANSQGSMEGIAISQNRGISIGIYMVNSTNNSFNTIFGHSNMTHGLSTIKKKSYRLVK